MADRTDHAALAKALAGERVDALVDVTYAPTRGDDVDALLDALAGRVGHVLFVSTGRVYDHALPIPFDEYTPRNLYWGDYANNKIAGEDALLGVTASEGLAVTIVRPTHVYGPLNTRNNETFFFDRLLRGRPILVPDAAAGSASSATSRTSPTRWWPCSAFPPPSAGLQRQRRRGHHPGRVRRADRGGHQAAAHARRRVPCRGSEAAPFGQNLAYACHAVYTTAKIRRELNIRPRYSLAGGLAQTFEWYLREGLDRREIDFTAEDALLRAQGA